MKYSRLGLFRLSAAVHSVLFAKLGTTARRLPRLRHGTGSLRQTGGAGAPAELRDGRKAKAQPAGRRRPHAGEQQLRESAGNAGGLRRSSRCWARTRRSIRYLPVRTTSTARLLRPSANCKAPAPRLPSFPPPRFAQFTYSQTFETGTNVQAGLSSNNNYTNNSFNLYNPYINSLLNFQITQPLLKNGWLFANRAPLVIARRNLDAVARHFRRGSEQQRFAGCRQYWTVVEARGNLEVAQSSMEAAEATYKRDKRALELGALPPLDIYRSESQVASRRVQVIQSEYALKQAEDALRMTIGADQDPNVQALDLELTEKPEPEGELRTIDTATALQQALTKRPEFDAARAALASDETSIRLAHNHLLPRTRPDRRITPATGWEARNSPTRS